MSTGKIIIRGYRDLQIVKHALQCYIKRKGASEKDINQEKRLLEEVTDEVNEMKERCGIVSKPYKVEMGK